MKQVADAAFAVACLVVVAVVVRNQVVPDGKPEAREKTVAAGTAFPGLPDDGRTTFVLYLSPSCAFCQESMPFYRRLSARVQQSSATALAFPIGGAEAGFRAYLSENSLEAERAAPLPVVAGVRGTPTILMVQAGAVVDSWVGRLSADQEQRLLARVR